MNKSSDIKRLILVSSYGEILYAEYIYKKLLSNNIASIVITEDTEIYKNLLLKKINCELLNLNIPTISNKKNLVNLIKTSFIIPRLLYYKFKLSLYFRKFNKLDVIYYFGGHNSRSIPFIICSLKKFKIICFDYLERVKEFQYYFKKLNKINFLFHKPSIYIFFKIYNFLSGSKYKMILTKSNLFLTIKQKKFENEKILNLSDNFYEKINEVYAKSKKKNYIEKSVVILYHEHDLFFKNFKIKKFVNDLIFLLEQLEQKNYSIFFKVHPHWNKSVDGKNILKKYEKFKFQVLDNNSPVEDISFTPDFFIGGISNAFKFLRPRNKNLIFTFEKYYPYGNLSPIYNLSTKYLESNEKNIFYSSIKDFTKNL